MIIRFTKKTNNSKSVLSESSNKYENFCNQDRRGGRPDMGEIPENMEPPEGMEPLEGDMGPPAGMGNFSDMRSKIEEFCEDGEIDESEAAQLDELLEDMPSGPSNNFIPKSN